MRSKFSLTRISIVLTVLASFMVVWLLTAASPTGTIDLATALRRVETIQTACVELEMMLKNGLQAKATVEPLPKRSPKQIDRPAIGNEKTQALVEMAKLSIPAGDTQSVVIALMESKRSGNFLKSLRSQATDWLNQLPEERTFDSPLSEKQLAWAGFLCGLAGYGNPKITRPDLYPKP